MDDTNQTPPSTQDDDYQVRMYQDEVDTDASDTDPVIPEETDDPTQVLGVPPGELSDELDKEDMSEDHEDMREYIEDQGDGDGSSAVTT